MGTLEFWQLGDRSDAAVLAALERLVGTTRQLTAELVAHLGEVEERRLHLLAACGSMFQYCTLRLGLSEDEACRRIEVARLARRFPLLFPALARGALSLSVAALLKPHLSEENQVELVRRLSGKSVRQAEECLAALFPRADVASSVRKLPRPVSERVASAGGVGAMGSALASSETGRLEPDADARRAATVGTPTGSDGTVSRPCGREAVLRSTGATGNETGACSAGRPNRTSTGDGCGELGGDPSGTRMGDGSGELATSPVLDSAPRSRPVAAAPRRGGGGRFEPLSDARYRVQFTASLALKEKLELARDLMRHANPSGDFAPIVERALDLLLLQLMQRRFGKTRRAARDSASAATAPPRTSSTSTGAEGSLSESEHRPAAGTPSSESEEASGAARTQSPAEPSAGDGHACAPKPPPPGKTGSATRNRRSSDKERITTATRRAVSARDGLQCSWVDAQGRRCPSRAWLELEHRQPRGKGGSSEAHNIHIYCRAHNQLAAEQEYGREHMGRFVRRGGSPKKGTPPLTVRDGREPRWLTRRSSTGSGRSHPSTACAGPSALSRIMHGDAERPGSPSLQRWRRMPG